MDAQTILSDRFLSSLPGHPATGSGLLLPAHLAALSAPDRPAAAARMEWALAWAVCRLRQDRALDRAALRAAAATPADWQALVALACLRIGGNRHD